VPTYAHSDEAAEFVRRLQTEVIDLFHAHGAAHFQIGRAYPYMRDRNPASVALLRAVKRELDPHNILNPGALGL
jgi:D-lactate dehydrogenase (cytochrome)